MYEAGGVAYVYLCYGIHHLFNVVTHEKGVPHAVLIRAAEPMEGMRLMSARTGRMGVDRRLCSGPGRLSRAMGITTSLSGVSLRDGRILLADDGFVVPADSVLETPRIGVDYAGEDALLPYRFIVAGHPGLSGRRLDNVGG
jgi:DNA-3-methyladenine glycosylase